MKILIFSESLYFTIFNFSIQFQNFVFMKQVIIIFILIKKEIFFNPKKLLAETLKI